MSKDKELKKLYEELEKIAPSDEFEKLKNQLLQEIKAKERKLLAKEIAKELAPLVGDSSIEKEANVFTVEGENRSIEILPQNKKRKGLYIFNGTSHTAYILFGKGASEGFFTIKIPSENFYELAYPVYTGSIEASFQKGFLHITETM